MTRTVERSCDFCGATFTAVVNGRRRFCNRECQVRHSRTRPGVTHLRLRPELLERLKAEADARDVSMVWLANRLLAEGIDRLVPPDEMRLTRDTP